MIKNLFATTVQIINTCISNPLYAVVGGLTYIAIANSKIWDHLWSIIICVALLIVVGKNITKLISDKLVFYLFIAAFAIMKLFMELQQLPRIFSPQFWNQLYQSDKCKHIRNCYLLNNLSVFIRQYKFVSF